MGDTSVIQAKYDKMKAKFSEFGCELRSSVGEVEGNGYKDLAL